MFQRGLHALRRNLRGESKMCDETCRLAGGPSPACRGAHNCFPQRGEKPLRLAVTPLKCADHAEVTGKIAVALLRLHYGKLAAFGVAAATGLVEPLGGLVGVASVSVVAGLLPWGLAFAAGAMIFVISHEVVPETHRRGYESQATAGLMVGVVVMLLIDAALA